MKHIFVLFLFSINVYALNPLCNGTCLECKMWYPMIKETAISLQQAYLKAEKGSSNRYNATILPLLEDRKKLLRQYDELMAEYETLNKITIINLKKIIKEKEK